jgi:hypothetical protein
MKLPNASRAVVDIAKLRDYSLNPKHPEGKQKARVFAATLELTESDANWLREELLHIARQMDCEPGRQTDHGQRYLIDFPLTVRGKTAQLRSAWIVRQGENFPRLTTCYVL